MFAAILSGLSRLSRLRPAQRPPRRARLEVEALEDRAVPAVLVLGSDGNLWSESPGWQNSGRWWVDGSVKSFAQGSDGFIYVLGQDGNLWKENAGWQILGRTWVDYDVQSFAYGRDGYLYVLGTDGNLWKEEPYWQSYGRTEIDSSVRSFVYGSDGYEYVLGTDLNLWREQAGWQTNGRTWIDGSVRSFDLGSDYYDYVLGTDGNLWKELPGWKIYGRTWVDYDVRGFTAGNDGWSPVPDPRPAAAAAYSPAPASDVLFGSGGPSYLDVAQGEEGDCWLMASLAEVAVRAPADITNMFTYDGTVGENGAQVGVYTVRFFNGSGSAEYVTVDTELPSGGSYYDRPVGGAGAVNGSSSPVLWPALAEKAYAEANGDGFVTSSNGGTNSYDALNGGDPALALQAITGHSASDYQINFDPAISWNAGQLVVLNTTSPASSYIEGGHSYAMVGYNPSSSQPYQVFNPWGTDSSGWALGHPGTIWGLFSANAAFLGQNFSTQSVGTGAAPGGQLAPSDTAGVGLAAVPSAATTVDSSTITRNETNVATGGGAGEGATPSQAPTACLVSWKRSGGTPGIGGAGTVGALTDPLIVGNHSSASDETIDP
jgi:hypothetical protein